MSRPRSYGSPTAFRRALTDRLKTEAKKSQWTIAQLQRQFAYDRLLQRLYLIDDGWVVKGATALLARGIGVRGTIDIDIYRAVEQHVAEADLRRAAATDIADWFTFEIGPSQPVAGAACGIRLRVTAFIGTAIWADFHVDLVGSAVRMTGEPEAVQPLARIAMPDVEQHGYRAYPLVDHIADKVAAIFEYHGALSAPSTRYKDLVDLVAIIISVSVNADAQMIALRSEEERRSIKLPERFAVPDTEEWGRGYRAEARRSLLRVAHTLDEALAIVTPFLEPLFDGTAVGSWRPPDARWTS